jgi:hypothetical protein
MLARLRADVATLAWRGHRLPATGCVWIDADGYAFPSARWSDFVIVIVAAFVQAELALIEQESAEVFFMEGPHEVRVARTHVMLRTNGAIVRAGDMDPVTWRRSVVELGEALLEQCKANGWTSRDVESLERGLRALEPSEA